MYRIFVSTVRRVGKQDSERFDGLSPGKRIWKRVESHDEPREIAFLLGKGYAICEYASFMSESVFHARQIVWKHKNRISGRRCRHWWPRTLAPTQNRKWKVRSRNIDFSLLASFHVRFTVSDRLVSITRREKKKIGKPFAIGLCSAQICIHPNTLVRLPAQTAEHMQKWHVLLSSFGLCVSALWKWDMMAE